MVLAFVTAVIDPVLSTIHFAGPEITFNELFSVLLTVCALMFFCWKAPQLASSLLAGSPHLGVIDVLQAAGAPIAAGMALNAVGSRAMAGLSATRAAASAGQGGRAGSIASAASNVGSAAAGAGGGGGAGGAEARGEGAGGEGKGSGRPSPRAGAPSSLVESAMGKGGPAGFPDPPRSGGTDAKTHEGGSR